MTQANLWNTSRVGMLSSPDNTKLRIRANSVHAAGVVTRLGVANPTTDVTLEHTLESVKKWNQGTKAGDKNTLVLDLTTVVKATAQKWMEKANGSTDANKFYLMGSQSNVESAAAAPIDTHSVYTVAVVPRHATKTALASVTVANATSGVANLKHDVCMNAKDAKKATCEAKPLRALAMNEVSFFTQVATTAVLSKAAFTTVEYDQSHKLVGACNDATKLKTCSL